MKIFIKPINYLLELKENFNMLYFENKLLYRKIVYDLFEELVFSEDEKVLDNMKNILFIDNPIYLDLNSKKINQALIKDLLNQLTDEQKMRYNELESDAIKFIDEVCENSDYHIKFDSIIPIANYMSIFNISLENIDFDNYLELLLNYIKINMNLFNYKLIITNNLCNILSEDEILQIKKELAINDLYLIDLQVNKIETEIKYITIDEDYCLI